jgi:hypothetical protein
MLVYRQRKIQQTSIFELDSEIDEFVDLHVHEIPVSQLAADMFLNTTSVCSTVNGEL